MLKWSAEYLPLVASSPIPPIALLCGKGGEMKGMGLGPIFPVDTILAKQFPLLNTLVLQLPILSKENIRKYFPGENYLDSGSNNIDVLPTLQNLELDCKTTIFGLKSLAKKFPNVTNIKAKNFGDIFSECDSAWCLPWANLKSLELGVFRFDNNLDSFLTGFSEEDCQLRKAGRGNSLLDAADMKILKSRGSLRDLQNLKKIKLVFDHESNSDWEAKVREKCDVSDNEGEELITQLTIQHVFNLMPELHRIIIAYDRHHRLNSAAVSAAFKPLSNLVFVTFDHEAVTHS